MKAAIIAISAGLIQLAFVIWFVTSVPGTKTSWEDPHELFSTRSNQYQTVVVIWQAVDDIQTECNTANLRRTGRSIGYDVDACSYNDGNVCYVLTPRETTTAILGHEARHCYQGAFHQ